MVILLRLIATRSALIENTLKISPLEICGILYDIWQANCLSIVSSVFPTTRWTLILTAGSGDSIPRQAALSELCQIYWLPVYAFIRHKGHSSDAQDVTQAFFLYLIQRPWFERASPERGRFRSYLLASLKHFLSDQHDYVSTARRGGQFTFLPLDFEDSFQKHTRNVCSGETPETIFDRNYALAVVRRAGLELRSAFIRDGKEVQFDTLQQFLALSAEPSSYNETAKQLGMTAVALRVSVHRLRRRYRDLIRDEIAHTVASSEEIDGEVRYLLDALAS